MAHELAGKNFIVTGGNSGIGMAAAQDLARRGARVIIASRSQDKTMPVIDEIKRATGNDAVEYAKLDLSDLDSVRACADGLKGTYDVLINNVRADVWHEPPRSLPPYEAAARSDHQPRRKCCERLALPNAQLGLGTPT
jgi:NAD(P)-dependent dehydrogenase (short-subunit alcohol dehydrogenase family)